MSEVLEPAKGRRMRGRRRRDAGRRVRGAEAILAGLLLVSPGPTPACAGAATHDPPPTDLRVASWDLFGAPLPPPPPKPDFHPEEEEAPAWRTTFGSERKHVEREKFKGPVTIDADVVLLQGVTDVTAVRRLFPAWHWRFIVSRRVLAARGSLRDGGAPGAAPAPVTAIAVRARRGLRITGRDELRELHDIEADVGATPSGVTVLRVSDSGRSLWFLSVSLPETCSTPDGACPARDYLAAWRQRKREAGEATVAGGRFSLAGSKALPPSPCPHQTIEADGKAASDPPLRASGATRAESGCVAQLDLKP